MKNSDLEKVYDPNYIYHFGIWIDKRKIRTYLNRENYCVVDKKIIQKFLHIMRFWKIGTSGKSKRKL